jgi:hypothetical protein
MSQYHAGNAHLAPEAMYLMRVVLSLGHFLDASERLYYFRTLLATESGVLPATLFISATNSLPLNFYFWSDFVQVGCTIFQIAMSLVLITDRHTTLLTWLQLYFAMMNNCRIAPFRKGGDVLSTWLTLTYALVTLPTMDQSPRSRRSGYWSYSLFVIVFYFVVGLIKTDTAWRNGQAVSLSLYNRDVTPIGQWFSSYHNVHSFITPIVVPFEMFAPFLLVLIRRDSVQFAICLFFILFHISLGLCFYLGTLTVFSVALWVGLLPGRIFRCCPRKQNSHWEREIQAQHEFSKNANLIRSTVISVVFVICCIFVFVNLSDYPSVQVTGTAREIQNTLSRFGFFSFFYYYRTVPRSREWFQLSMVDSISNRRRFYDFVDGVWLDSDIRKRNAFPVVLTNPTMNNRSAFPDFVLTVPINIHVETVKSRRWQGFFGVLRPGGFYQKAYLSFLSKKMCSMLSPPPKTITIEQMTQRSWELWRRSSLNNATVFKTVIMNKGCHKKNQTKNK